MNNNLIEELLVTSSIIEELSRLEDTDPEIFCENLPSMQGPIGPQGAQGAIGKEGARGPQGLRGFVGPTGERGETGIPGPIGTQGKIGPKGDRGEPGIPGHQGPIGADGNAGPRGAQGPEGVIGFTGEKGDPGPRGQKGETGSRGIQGAKGDTGNAGPEGKIGPTGNEYSNTIIVVTEDYDVKQSDKFIVINSYIPRIIKLYSLPTENIESNISVNTNLIEIKSMVCSGNHKIVSNVKNTINETHISLQLSNHQAIKLISFGSTWYTF